VGSKNKEKALFLKNGKNRKRGPGDFKPQTFMNLSGKAVKEIVDNLRLKLENMLVVYDDIDIPLGEIRIRKGGGGGSHKGVISIIEELNTKNFPRLRIGIGKESKVDDLTQYVLSPFEEEEIPLLKEGLNKAKMAIEIILKENIEKAMSLFNKKRSFSPCLSSYKGEA